MYFHARQPSNQISFPQQPAIFVINQVTQVTFYDVLSRRSNTIFPSLSLKQSLKFPQTFALEYLKTIRHVRNEARINRKWQVLEVVLDTSDTSSL